MKSGLDLAAEAPYCSSVTPDYHTKQAAGARQAAVAGSSVQTAQTQTPALPIECAELSLIGDREENQDRVAVLAGGPAALLLAVDGMGGHADGARAAELACEAVASAFHRAPRPLLDPQGFLHLALGRAHEALVNLGARLPLEARPRATCAMALVQDGVTWWAHVGDSRIYLLRAGRILARTRDHSHVELLLQEGLITEDEIAAHPMRNYVESCIGGSRSLPGMSIARSRRLAPGDVLLACTDGFWSGLLDEDLALLDGAAPLRDGLSQLVQQAVQNNRPHSDNSSAVALRWSAPGLAGSPP